MAAPKESAALDLTSPEFDPETALSQPEDVILPVPSARPFNNISEYFNFCFGKDRQSFHAAVQRQKKDAAKPVSGGEIKSKPQSEEAIPSTSAQSSRNVTEKENLPGTSQSGTKPQRQFKDILTIMESFEQKGPFSLLHKCLKNRIKIKIWTRNDRCLRGICSGFLVAFDKHWNLALRDVDEVYTRKKGKSLPAMPSTEPTQLRFLKKGATVEQRHVKQLFIRGDNVAMVSALSGTDCKDS